MNKLSQKILIIALCLFITACETTGGLKLFTSKPKTEVSSKVEDAKTPENIDISETFDIPEPMSEDFSKPMVRDDMVRIAMLLPLSGSSSKIGKAMRNAATMAQYEVGGDRLVLQFYDTKGTPEDAAIAAREAISQGARLIIGPLFAASVQAVAEKARSAGINVITFSNDPSVLGNGVYTIGLLVSQQVEKIISHAFASGFTRFAVLAPDNQTGSTVVEAMRQITTAKGAELARIGYYNSAETDFSQVVKQLVGYKEKTEQEKAKGVKEEGKWDESFDAVLIADEGTRLRTLASMLPYYNVYPSKVKFLGTSMWDDASLANEASLLNGWYPALPKRYYQSFAKRYERNFKTKVVRISSLAYDAIALAAVIARNSDSPRFSKSELTSSSGFSGVDGIFRLLPDGNCERGLAIMSITQAGGAELVPAPETFATVNVVE